MASEPDDRELMIAYAGGDEPAFNQLFLRYSGRLTAFFRFRLGAKKRHLAEELFQKTWLKVHSSRKSYDSKHTFSTWFFTIALNNLRDEVRLVRERSQHQQLFESSPDSDLDPTHRPQKSTEERYIEKESFHQIEALFPLLTDNQKTALLLSDLEEMDSREIAQTMGISDVSVRQLVSRARKVLREHLQNEEKV